MAINKKIVLGSGKLYATVFDGESIPEDATLETDDNLLGLISGGATLTYEPEFYTAKDDLGIATKKMVTNEEVTLTSGIMTWNGNTLAKLVNTGRVDETEAGKRTVKIGGVGNYDGKQYVLRFVHEDAAEGDIRITIVGANEAGFEMSFKKDEETVIDAEFTAFPIDDDGTLIIFEEEDSTVSGS
ncbi:hypothetical protein H7U34_01835 [Collinsella tanakaei]|nr:hypothetical protein [Collinsella tanakaei]